MAINDYLGKHQVKMFRIPTYYDSSLLSRLRFIGGEINSFHVGEKLPLQTLWYKYPMNFIILDENVYNNEQDIFKYIIHIVKNGCYYKTIELDNFNDCDFGDAAYDYSGNKLNAKCLHDIHMCINLNKKLVEDIDLLELKYFSKCTNSALQDNAIKDSDFEAYQKDLDALYKGYHSKIYDNYDEEYKIIGAYLYLAISAYNQKDNETSVLRDYGQYYINIKRDMKNYLDTLPSGYMERYLEWVGEYLNTEQKEIIIALVNKEILD